MPASIQPEHAEIQALHGDHHVDSVGWLRRRIGGIDRAHDLAQE